MDDAIDQMQKTAKAVMLFDMRSFTPEMKERGNAVVKCALLVEEAIPLLRSISREAARINAITEQIGRIEGDADDLHDAGVRALFERHRRSSRAMTASLGVELIEKTSPTFPPAAEH